MYLAAFQSPHGILMEIWGEGEPEPEEKASTIPTAEEMAEESIVESGQSLLDDEEEETDLEDLDEDDLFEEVHDEPGLKDPLEKSFKPKAAHSEPETPEEDFEEDVRYVDEPDTAYPTYQPIPLRK